MFRVLFFFLGGGKRDDVSKGTFWILVVVVGVFISRVLCPQEMMMATPMMQHAPATTPVAVEVRGDRRRLFVFVKVFFFFFVVVVVVVFRDWIFGYERGGCLSMMIYFRLDAKRAWHDLTFLFLSLSLESTTPQRFSFKRACSSRATVFQTAKRTASPRGRCSALKVENKSVLIVNTNGGGHANIGFWLSKTLASAKHDVTLCVVGEETDKKMQKAPFTYFDADLKPLGVTTMWSNPADLKSKLGGAKFDIVCDNNGKDLENVGPVAEFAKEAGAEQFFFVSSAGIYKPTPTPPHVEGDAVKETAGHAVVEKHLVDMKFTKGMTSFRPQYLTGYGSNKDCEEYFFDRIQRGKPIVIPGSGDQFASVSHAEDLATMIASAVDNANAKDEIFNCVTQKGVTLRGMAEVCAKAMGKEATIVTYKEGSVEGVETKKQFPFRAVHFYASSAKAMAKLGWEPKHPDLEATLKDRYAEYCASGRDKKEMTFDLDEKVLATL